MFKHAIVRPPTPNFASGLTSVDLGAPGPDPVFGKGLIGAAR